MYILFNRGREREKARGRVRWRCYINVTALGHKLKRIGKMLLGPGSDVGLVTILPFYKQNSSSE